MTLDTVGNKTSICLVQVSSPNEMLNLTPATCLLQTRGDILNILDATGYETNIAWQLKCSRSLLCRSLWLCIVSLPTVMCSFTKCPKQRKSKYFQLLNKVSGIPVVIKTQLAWKIASALIGHHCTCCRPAQ